MSYFSRLSDIVTCNISEILAGDTDPKTAIEHIIREMEEGLTGARRSVTTAESSIERLSREMDDLHAQVDHWVAAAKKALTAEDERQARLALLRKQEVEDVLAGLRQQHQAAIATRDHLSTTFRALEARLAEARRRQQQFETDESSHKAATTVSVGGETVSSAGNLDESRSRKLESELEALKRELGKA